MTQILKPVFRGHQLNIAILGDRFLEAYHSKYNNRIKKFIQDEKQWNDYFREDKSALNTYRVNSASQESGVSHRFYDEKGIKNDASDDIMIIMTMKATALHIYYGSWDCCWPKGSTSSDTSRESRWAL